MNMVLIAGAQENTDTHACRFHGKNILCVAVVLYMKNNEQ
jgi:hypothetical protein